MSLNLTNHFLSELAKNKGYVMITLHINNLKSFSEKYKEDSEVFILIFKNELQIFLPNNTQYLNDFYAEIYMNGFEQSLNTKK